MTVTLQLTFLVEDFDGAYEKMKGSGVKITREPVSMPSGLKMFHVVDLNGVKLGFVKEASL